VKYWTNTIERDRPHYWSDEYIWVEEVMMCFSWSEIQCEIAFTRGQGPHDLNYIRCIKD
jgi:hypothetical protein